MPDETIKTLEGPEQFDSDCIDKIYKVSQERIFGINQGANKCVMLTPDLDRLTFSV